MQYKISLTESFRHTLNRLDSILQEASYDGMVTSLKSKYPDYQSEIAEQLKWAKAIFKKDDKIVWYMRQVGQSLNALSTGQQGPDLQAIQDEIGHFFGFGIPAVDDYQFSKKTVDEIKSDLSVIEQKWREKQGKKSSNRPGIQPREGDYELIKFNDGSAWWWVDRAYCEKEGEHGSHCGNITGKSKPNQRILSLRKNGQVLLTFILEPDGKLGEMKAYNNQKPSEKLHPQIMGLLLNDKVKGIQGGGYLQDNNFSVFDLNDEQLKAIQAKKPQLIADQIKVNPSQALRAPAWVRKMYINEISRASSGLKYLINSKTGEFTNNEKAWDKAISVDPKLSLNVPDNLIPKYKEQILSILKKEPSLLITRASRAIRRDFDILKEFAVFDYKNIGYVQPTTPRYNELCKIAVSEYVGALQYVPEELRKPELCEIAISQNVGALLFVPEELRKPEWCRMAVSEDATMLSEVPEKLRDYELCKMAVSEYGGMLREVPEKLRDYELCKMAVSQNGEALKYVPDPILQQHPELYKIAVSEAPTALAYVPPEVLQQHPEIWKSVIRKDKSLLSDKNEYAQLVLPNALKTPEMYLFGVEIGYPLDFVPEKMRTPEMYEIACARDYRLSKVPDEIKTDDFYENVLSRNGRVLYQISERYRTPEWCKIAVSSNGEALELVPPEVLQQHPEIYKIAVSQNGIALEYVPEELRNFKLCKIAVSNDSTDNSNYGYTPALASVPPEVLQQHPELYKLAVSKRGDALAYVPEKMRTLKFCEFAIKHGGYAVSYVPEEIIQQHPELYKMAVSQDGTVLQEVPEELRTPELCKIAVSQSGWALSDVPPKLRDYELCKLAVSQNGEALKYVPGPILQQHPELSEIANQNR